MQAKLTELTRIKSILGIDPADVSEDSNIDFAILTTSAAVESYLNRSLNRKQYTDVAVSASSRQWIQLPEWPVLQVDEIKEDGELLDPADYVVDGSSGVINRLGKKLWQKDITATFIAGYVMPEDNNPPDDPRTLPYDIENACIMWAIDNYQNITRIGISRESVEGISVAYETPFTRSITTGGRILPAPPTVMSLLNPYRRVM